MNVSFKKVIENGVLGYVRIDDGPENAPNVGTWFSRGMLRNGDGLREATKVTVMVVEPESSVATRSTGIPTTSPSEISLGPGVPNRRREELSIDSHGGGFAREYVIVDEDLKVEGEKTNENGCPTLATGGTCELMGKEILGVASDSPGSKRAAKRHTKDAIIEHRTENNKASRGRLE